MTIEATQRTAVPAETIIMDTAMSAYTVTIVRAMLCMFHQLAAELVDLKTLWLLRLHPAKDTRHSISRLHALRGAHNALITCNACSQIIEGGEYFVLKRLHSSGGHH